VSKYGVNVRDIDEIGTAELKRGMKNEKIIVIDEIGKMELYSDEFRKILMDIFNSELDVIATIMYKSNFFADRIKSLEEVDLLKRTRGNRDKVRNKLMQKISDKN